MTLGTPLSPAAIKVMLLGSGELGKEVVIELQRLGWKPSPWTATPMPRRARSPTAPMSST